MNSCRQAQSADQSDSFQNKNLSRHWSERAWLRAADIDRRADLELQAGHHLMAARLSHLSQAGAGGDSMNVEALQFDVAETCLMAQNLARNLQFAVFPCRPDKKPATPHGFRDATAEPAAVEALWQRYPGARIGVQTGQKSDISVVDIDTVYDEARVWWLTNEVRLPITRAYRTRRGGLHLVFRHAPGIRNIEGRPVKGIDVRGDGGYVVWWFAAGFECLDHAPPAPWPHWLTALFWPPPPKKAPTPQVKPLSNEVLDDIRQRAVDRVRNAEDGQKHHRLRASARLLGGIAGRAGFTDEQAIEWLVDALPDSADDLKNAEKTAAWGLKKGRGEPLLIREGRQ